METYEIDRSINEYMVSYTNIDVSKYITRIFNTLNNINNLPDLDKTIDLSNIESIIVSIITTEDEVVSNLNLNIRKVILEQVTDYLKELGIMVNKDTLLYSELTDILEGLYTLYTLDHDNMVYLSDTLDINREELNNDIILTFCNILSEHTTMSTLALYEIIEDVMSDILVNLVEYFKIKIEEYTRELNKAIEAPLKELMKVENLISETYFYKNIMSNGYVENDISYYIDDLYSNIDKHGDNLAYIAPEILITLYLATDTNDDIMVSYDNHIDLSITEYCNDDTRISTIREMLSGYVTKLRGV